MDVECACGSGVDGELSIVLVRLKFDRSKCDCCRNYLSCAMNFEENSTAASHRQSLRQNSKPSPGTVLCAAMSVVTRMVTRSCHAYYPPGPPYSHPTELNGDSATAPPASTAPSSCWAQDPEDFEEMPEAEANLDDRPGPVRHHHRQHIPCHITLSVVEPGYGPAVIRLQVRRPGGQTGGNVRLPQESDAACPVREGLSRCRDRCPGS